MHTPYYDPSRRIVSENDNGLETGLDSVTSYRNTPVFDYGSMALIDEGAMYRNRIRQFEYDFLQIARYCNDSDEYEMFTIALPINNENATIDWKDTYRCQFSIPEGSFLISISGCAS